MWPDRVSNPGPLTYESGALPTALRSPAPERRKRFESVLCIFDMSESVRLYLLFKKFTSVSKFYILALAYIFSTDFRCEGISSYGNSSKSDLHLHP